MEIDVHFVRKSVRAIGKLAIKIEPAAKKCINALLELVSTKVSYIVQEATVVIRNIFRRYPNQYESIISTLCEHLDSLDEPEAKAAMIWVIGQYADRIQNSDALLEDFLDSFLDEPIEVQLALLTATVKLFIQRPTRGQELVPKVLKWATEETDNPDLRDRGYMYWRLLSTDAATAKAIIMGDKPPITAESEKLDPVTLEEMCLNVGTLATVYLKPIHQIFRSARPRRLHDSPALQKDQLPQRFNLDRQKTLPGLGLEGQPVHGVDPRNRPLNGHDRLSTVNDVQPALSQLSINGQGQAFMGVDNMGISSPGTDDRRYVVNQNAPEQSGALGGSRDLLM
jgi:AP-2 complex subunit beta-1